ncbi:MAG: hypothetical protein QXD86_06510 [Candidatus Bathyarchaeia archaeon]
MEYDIPPRDREILIAKMTEALREDMSILPNEFQQILVDDLVTAFCNRIKVLIRIHQKKSSSSNP